MRQPRRDLSSEFVHITQRGLGRRIIFEEDADRRRYLAMLKNKAEDCGVSILAWTLMENHVHLLVKAPSAALSRMMQRVGAGYAQYFNGRHGHVGKVFQNRFSSEAIETDDHLLAAIRYIHRNAETAGVASASVYPWSSYCEIAGKSVDLEGEGLCDVAAVCEIFGGVDEFKRFHAMADEQDGFAWIDGYRPRMSDDEAREIAQRCCGTTFADRIVSMPKVDRDKALRLLKDHGLSIRQIERLTGVGRGPISRA